MANKAWVVTGNRYTSVMIYDIAQVEGQAEDIPVLLSGPKLRAPIHVLDAYNIYVKLSTKKM